MFDFTGADISKIIVHGVGNRLKNEGIIISSHEIGINDTILKNLLLKYFLSSFKGDILHAFKHESNLSLNEIYTFSKNIFRDKSSFVDESVNILKHLYEASTHPNVKSGELYLAYISNCIVNDKITDAIGIFKSENKETYIKTSSQNESYDIQYHSGININKLDKGCLIFNINPDEGYRVAIVDSSNGNEAVYWREDFLNTKIYNNEYVNTKSFLDICKKFTNDVYNKEKNDKISFLNNSVEYFKNNDEFNLETFIHQSIEETEYIDKFKKFVEDHEKESIDVDYKHFEISPRAVKTVKRNLKNYIKLDTDVEIRINANMRTGKKVIEKGFDKEKGMHYYKIYFNNEE